MPIETAVILAAGAGTKFWPYNVVRNKVAFPIANVPAVRRVADGLIALGVTRLVVVVGTGEASVRHALRGAAGDIRYVRQPHAAGTADAVLHAAGHVDGDFLVVYGDVVTDPANLVAVRDAFEATRPLAATLVQPFKEEDPRSWIVAHVDGDALRGVEGHARGGSHRLGGVFALRLDALPFLQDNPGIMKQVPVGGMPPVDNELAQSLQMMLDEHHDVAAVEAVGYYVDLDKPWHILEANWRVISHMTAALTESVIPASARIHDGAELAGPVVLGENVEIGNRVVARGVQWRGAGHGLLLPLLRNLGRGGRGHRLWRGHRLRQPALRRRRHSLARQGARGDGAPCRQRGLLRRLHAHRRQRRHHAWPAHGGVQRSRPRCAALRRPARPPNRHGQTRTPHR
jgi:NDP-sugar pyrophosphorylase family protein